MPPIRFFLFAFISFCASASAAEFLPGVHRIVVLGDSITHAGYYVDQFEAFLATRWPDREIEVINLGLPSETVSGLSEPGHAGGKFPRPNLHERLDRVLAKSKPDLVIACYGMNDGIYEPLSEANFAKYREGIEKLRAKVMATGAKIIHLTPPVFDSEPIKSKTDTTGKPGKMYTGYDEVLTKYSEWLLSKRADGWRVIDLHGIMRKILDARRAAEPGFTFAKDGVHPTEAAHWIFSMELVGELSGDDRPAAMEFMNKLHDPATPTELIKMIHQRGRILSDAWLTDIGHSRPGMTKGLPLEEAQPKAKELSDAIRRQAALLAPNKGTIRL
jgi:lysophospholipase L1-like esterase